MEHSIDNLSGKGRIVLKAGSIEDRQRLESALNNSFSADTMKSFLREIWDLIPHDAVVKVNGKPEPFSKFLKGKTKPTYFYKEDCVRILALLLSHSDNVRWLFDQMPSYVLKATKAVLEYGYAGTAMLEEIGASKAFTKKVSRNSYWYQYEDSREKSRYMEFFGILNAPAHDPKSYSYEKYIFLPDILRTVYSQAFMPPLRRDELLADNPEEGLKLFDAEKEFVASFPVFMGLFRQGQLEKHIKKITAVSSAKIMKNLAIPEIIPAAVRDKFKINTGQYFIPFLALSLYNRESDRVEDVVKKAFSYFEYGTQQFLFTPLLPHIKGFKSNVLCYGRSIRWGMLMKMFLCDEPDKWLSLDLFRELMYRGTEGEFYGCPLNDFRSMPLTNTISSRPIFPDTQWKEIDAECIKAIAVAMYGMGMVEVAVDSKSDSYPESPSAGVRRIRLTGLGKYAIGLSERYESEAAASTDWFRLDPEHLIVSSETADNPYVSLLSEISTPIGNGKYLVDNKSFLKSCSSLKDVQEKIKFFNDFICSDPSQLWKEFFEDLQKHCMPFGGADKEYMMMSVKGYNPEVAGLLSEDPELRRLILLVEGGRFLVSTQDFPEFERLMRSRGYLI